MLTQTSCWDFKCCVNAHFNTNSGVTFCVNTVLELTHCIYMYYKVRGRIIKSHIPFTPVVLKKRRGYYVGLVSIFVLKYFGNMKGKENSLNPTYLLK